MRPEMLDRNNRFLTSKLRNLIGSKRISLSMRYPGRCNFGPPLTTTLVTIRRRPNQCSKRHRGADPVTQKNHCDPSMLAPLGASFRRAPWFLARARANIVAWTKSPTALTPAEWEAASQGE